MRPVDLSIVPESAQTDLCVMAIMRTAVAMNTPQGREAIERSKEAYLRHLAEKENRAGASGARKEV